MEYILLTKVGTVISWVVKGGYALAGLYMAKTGVRYVQDYRKSVEREKVEL